MPVKPTLTFTIEGPGFKRRRRWADQDDGQEEHVGQYAHVTNGKPDERNLIYTMKIMHSWGSHCRRPQAAEMQCDLQLFESAVAKC